MNSFLYVVVFMFGLAIGSFLNSVVYRTEKGESFMRGRSYCPNCSHGLGFWDLVPVFSFLFLGGQCRYCKKKISWQYPLVEICTALLFVAVFYFQTSLLQFFYLLAVTSLLIIVFVYDFKHYLIPDKVVYLGIAISLAYKASLGWPVLANSLIAGAVGAGFFLFLVLVSKETWMGMGDAKLAAFMGLILGWPNILAALFLAVFAGAIIGLGLLAFKRKGLRSQVPFGPFLVAGTFISIFWAGQLISWYLNLFTML